MNIKPVSYSFEKDGRTVLAHLQLVPSMGPDGRPNQQTEEKWFFNTHQIMQMNGIAFDPADAQNVSGIYAEGEAERDLKAESILDALAAASTMKAEADAQIKQINKGVVDAFTAALGTSTPPAPGSTDPEDDPLEFE